MTLSIQTIVFDIALQELLLPARFNFATDQDLTSVSATLKVRANKSDAAPIITLSSPVDVSLGGIGGSFVITFTSAHFAALLAALTNGEGQYDMIFTPAAGTPQMPLAGRVVIDRTVSR